MKSHDDFYNFINELVIIFIDNFPIVALEDSGGIRVDYFNFSYTYPWNLFDKTYLLDLIVRFSIYTAVKFFD